jgi:hypothetical protein
MQTFVIKGEEHELKLTLKAVQHLNGLYEGNAFGLIQRALTGDIDTYVEVVFAGLFHTEKGFKKADVTNEIEQSIEAEKLDLDQVNRTCYAVVADSFFYKKTVEKMLSKDPKARKQIEELMK